MATIKAGPKRALVLVAIVGALWGYKVGAERGYFPRPGQLKTLIPLKAEVAKADVIESAAVPAVPLPGNSPAAAKGTPVRWLLWAWNAHMGANFANGGPLTTRASLMEQQSVRLQMTRENDTEKMTNEQIAFAEKYCRGGGDGAGAHFVSIMGDGAAQYVAPLNEKLALIAPDCAVEIVGSAGYSRGEDQFMGPPEWKANPQAARGGIVAGVLRDGDWNLAMRWADENKIPNNPDDKVYDPTALNWVGTPDYTDAAQKYASGFQVDLPVKGHPSQHFQGVANAAVTWTPGDVVAWESTQRADKPRPQLVSLMSTGSAIFSMPCVIIGNRKWNADHADVVAGMLAAIAQGADQIRSNPAALRRAGEISAAIYKEKDAEYWITYYRGVERKDNYGGTIHLGGSAVSNMADSFQLFGLAGGPNLFKTTYEMGAKWVVQQYPNVMKEYPPAAKITNTRYLQMAAARMEHIDKGAAEPVTYSEGPLKSVTGSRDYSVNFDTGSARILPDSFASIDGVAADMATSNVSCELHGFTDNTGTPSGNLVLSGSRAESVKARIVSRGVAARRITVFPEGQEMPVASNDTAAGRAANRRVMVRLGR